MLAIRLRYQDRSLSVDRDLRLRSTGISSLDMGLLVIFGAGASYDSVNPRTVVFETDLRSVGSDYHRPPLAAELFDARRNFNDVLKLYPHFIGRVPDLRRKAGIAGGLNVEHELEQIKTEAERYPPAAVELAAMRFYLRRVLWDCGGAWHNMAAGATNYAELLSRIQRWRLPRKEHVILVTFNYDLMLEMAAATFPIGLQIAEIDDYVGREEYKLIKPHGSVNWGQLLNHEPEASLSDEDAERTMIERAPELQFTDRFLITGLTVLANRRLYFPAIAIPVENKSEFACPPSHITTLVQGLDQIQHVLVVGWRASENHFLDILKGHLDNKRVLVVAENKAAAEMTATNLARAGVERNTVTCSDQLGFSGFLAIDELERFLQSD